MRRLTLSEEFKVLKRAYEFGHFIDNGSSRAVYQLDSNTVIKVASCIRGQYQNKTEIELYRYASDEHKKHLATIHSYGKYTIVMEMIEPIEFDILQDIIRNGTETYSDGLDYYGDYRDHLIVHEAELIQEHIDIMDFLLGETSDNLQAGIDINNNIKAFDYGYESGSLKKSVSDTLDEVLYSFEDMEDFLIYTAGLLVKKTYEEMVATFL